MAKKYNTKKSTLLGGYLKTEFGNIKKPTLTYKNTENDWVEQDELKSQASKNIDLIKQAFLGDKRRVKLALTHGENGANINFTDKNGNSALILAVYSGKEEVVKYLANFDKDEKGIAIEGSPVPNLNLLNNNGVSALHLAVKLNNTKIVKILLSAGANANRIGAYKETPIFEAVKQDNYQIIELLCHYNPENIADVNAKNREGATPLMIACQNRYRQESMLMLMKNSADIFVKDYAGRNALMHAANNDNGAMMDILLKKSGYSKDMMDNQDKAGISTLMICAKRGNREAVRVLLSRETNPFLVDDKRRDAIAYAENNNNHTCKEVIAKAMKIYIEANEKFGEDEKSKHSHLVNTLAEFGKQNRVNNSCVK